MTQKVKWRNKNSKCWCDERRLRWKLNCGLQKAKWNEWWKILQPDLWETQKTERNRPNEPILNYSSYPFIWRKNLEGFMFFSDIFWRKIFDNSACCMLSDIKVAKSSQSEPAKKSRSISFTKYDSVAFSRSFGLYAHTNWRTTYYI